MHLVQIPRDGNASLSGVILPEAATAVIASTVQLYARRGYVEPWVGYLAIEGNNCVGCCGFTSPPVGGVAEIAYFTYPGFEQRGIATRMAQRLISIAQECDPSVRIIAHTLTEENASNHLLRKLGFAFTGTVDHPEDGKIWEWSYEPNQTLGRIPPIAWQSGFTLIELLVVIGVIAVLASLLFPAFSRAKAQANSIRCRSNLRQMGLQLAVYVSDSSAYPSTDDVRKNLVGAGAAGISLVDGGLDLRGQDAEQGIKRCPTRVYPPSTGGLTLSITGGFASYGYNGMGYISPKGLHFGMTFGLAGTQDGGLYRAVREDEVRVPSEMIALGDNLALLPQSGSDFPVDTVLESLGGGLARSEVSAARGDFVNAIVKRAAARHRNQGNVEFCDGHVEALTFRSLFLDRDDASLRRWNRDNEPHR